MIPKPKGGIVSKRKTKGDMRAWPRRRRFPAIRIGRVNGSDRAFPDHFAKKAFGHQRNQIRGSTCSLGKFCGKFLNFS